MQNISDRTGEQIKAIEDKIDGAYTMICERMSTLEKQVDQRMKSV